MVREFLTAGSNHRVGFRPSRLPLPNSRKHEGILWEDRRHRIPSAVFLATAAESGRARLPPSRTPLGGRGSCRAGRQCPVISIQSSQSALPMGKAPAEPGYPASRRQFSSAGASPSRWGATTEAIQQPSCCHSPRKNNLLRDTPSHFVLPAGDCPGALFVTSAAGACFGG